MSLRLRVALIAALVTGVVVIIAGGILVTFVTDDQRQALDDRLDEDFEDASGRGTVRIVLEGLTGSQDIDPRDSQLGVLFTGRVLADGEVLVESDGFPDRAPEPRALGFATIVDSEDVEWRFLTDTDDIEIPQIADRGPLTVQVALPTAGTEETIADLRSLVVRVGVAAIVVVAVASWVLAATALWPLRRLSDQAEQVSTAEDLGTRVPTNAPREVARVAKSLNAMLRRLGDASAETAAALEASRAFAADVAHEVRAPLTSVGTNLDVLERNPDLPAEERRAIVAELVDQQERLSHLLDGLRLLARGDLAGPPTSDTVDVAGIVETAVEAAQARHPEVTWSLVADDGPFERDAWAEGLRVLVENLTENAARHGRPPGGTVARVDVEVRRVGDTCEITVGDNGPGPPPDPEELFDRFKRGAGSIAGGSGLGLALARQQATIHGGTVEMSRHAEGGTLMTAILPLDPVPGSDGRT